MFHLGIICEGDGEEAALPALLRRVEVSLAFAFSVGKPRNAHGKSNLTKPGGVESFYRYTALTHDAVLIVLDADRDCPVELASELAQRVRALQSAVPAAVVAANAAFEAWFLADLDSIVGQRVKGRVLVPAADDRPDHPDCIRNPKATLAGMIPRQTTYKETGDQPALATLIDLDIVGERSRSFRRLLGALRDLDSAVATDSADVTP